MHEIRDIRTLAILFFNDCDAFLPSDYAGALTLFGSCSYGRPYSSQSVLGDELGDECVGSSTDSAVPVLVSLLGAIVSPLTESLIWSSDERLPILSISLGRRLISLVACATLQALLVFLFLFMFVSFCYLFVFASFPVEA